MSSLPIAQAAAALGVSVPTLSRLKRAGCPVARHGRRGRGCSTLFDVDAVRAWQRSEGGQDALTAYAARIAEIVADQAWVTFTECTGPHKRACAAELAACWFRTTVALTDVARTSGATVPELSTKPDVIERLQKIARA